MSVARWCEVQETDSGETPWQHEGVYLILGGAGGLGRIFASEIIARVPTAHVVVAGRSPAVQALSDRFVYRQVDLAHAEEMEALVRGVATQFGRLNGILHCAGVLRDSLAVRKNSEELRAVLAPKVHGSVNLARAVATLEKVPDFLVLFGSTSGVLGNTGQFDYAAANGFQDVFANVYRTAAKRVLAIDWPLWREGGMRVDTATEAALRDKWGVRPLETASGLHAFYRAWQTGEAQVLVWNGTPWKIAELPGKQIAAQLANAASLGESDGNLRQRLKGVLAEVTGIKAVEIDEVRPFDTYGVDSILMTELSRKLEAVFPDISRMLLYEHDTVAALGQFLETHYPGECDRWMGAPAAMSARANPVKTASNESSPEADCRKSLDQAEPIAIIGLSIRFAGAETLSAFWRMLERGAIGVTEGPLGRWPLPVTEASSEKKRMAKWGGFLQEPYAFDPLFFGMTPREAEETDPQERLFLQECWKALEDAGYSVTDLPALVRRGTAVFGAITKQGYSLTGTGKRMPVTSFASLANRVSYHFDLQGPSLPIDTMCSSALVAVHHACRYLRQGGELAIVGAANLYLHPSTLAKLEADQLVSGTECSDPFGCRGDGFVPGEGIGALVLKALSKAERDGDAVYAVIRGTAVNHSGKSANYSAPSARQQAAVIQDALADAGVDLETIGYIETAANGSQTGDAAEAAAISKVFAQRAGSGANRYWMGSVKPNIGHPEAASGIAQIAKVILALRHGRLPPTVLSTGFEPCVPLERLPFELIRQTERWAPLILAGRPYPRRAGITGVGAGGVNAHVIVDEYIPVPPVVPEHSPSVAPVVLTISARTPEALQAYAVAWLDYLEAHPNADLLQLAYVAQVGRSAMSCRRAIVAAQLEDLKRQLRDTASAANPPAVARSAPAEGIELALAQPDWSSLARLWEQGAEVPWASLYAGQAVRRLHGLPVYPFARRDCSPDSPTMSALSATRIDTPSAGTTANRAIEFYSVWAQNSASEAREDFLTFCPFETRVPGFSMSRAFLFPGKYRQEWALMKAKQIELRQVLFYEEDFARFEAVFDIGCGFGSDLIGMANAYPKLRADGFSLTADQVKTANARIVQAGLQDRVRVWQRDSAQSAYPGRYDLVMGIEVTFHIREKDRLFANMVAALRPAGRILLMDFITNLRGAIVDPNLEISIPTKREWIELLSRHGLVLNSVIDVSPQIANFLHDPDYREVTRDLPELVQQTFQNYANQSRSLEQGWVTYCLLKVQKSDSGDFEELCRRNRNALDKPTPYPVALAAMRACGAVPYPRAESVTVAEIASLLTVPSVPVAGLKDELLALCAKELGFARAELSERASFRDLAVGSLEATRLTQAVNERFDLDLPTSVILECRTIRDFAVAIAARAQNSGRLPGPLLSRGEPVVAPEAFQDTIASPRPARPPSESDREAIAVIGLSLRCAGADCPETFWDLIREGRDAVGAIEDSHWLEVLRPALSPQAEYRRGMIRDRDGFDAAFFNLSPREGASMDVSQRLILEQTYKALEDAGYASDRLHQVKVGTFLGSSGSDSAAEDTSHFSLLGTDASVMASRIAYYLDLKGPALAVNAACASSLAAIDLAIQKMRGDEIDLAIAGGVAVFDNPLMMVRLHKAGLLSPTGLCRPFDAAANGFVLGDGVGVVILKRLVDAERDGDHIYGVIRGIAGNHNGQTLGFTVPSASAQSDLLSNLYARCGLAAADIQFVETNGTATKLGDLIELAALAQVYGRHALQKQNCLLGALKGNIGNCGAASGVLALIKVLLGLKHRTLPPLAGFLRPNPEFDLANSPFRVERTAIDWPENARGPRLAALSSFGFNGTNYHLVVEEYPAAASPSPRPARHPNVLLLSAQSRAQLNQFAGAIGTYLERHSDVPFEDILYTLRTGRRSHAVRLAIIAADRDRLARDLQNVAQGVDVDGDRVYLTQSNSSGPCLDDTPEGADFLAQLVANRRLNKLAELWVNGAAIDWSRLVIGEGTRRIAGLPTYPFARGAADAPAPPSSVAVVPTEAAASLTQALKTTLAHCLSLTAERLPNDASFRSLGLDSIVAAEWIAELNRRHGIVVGLQSLYEYPSIRQLADWLEANGVRPGLAPPAANGPLESRDDAASPPALPAVPPMMSCDVRPVSLADLETLSQLECALLAESLVTPLATLRERMEKNPGGNFLVERNGRITGYVSLQRVKSAEHLRRVTFEGLPSVLSDAAGEVLLLIALELLPDCPEVGLRAEVLSWVLRLGESIRGVKSVVHIARCTGFSGRNEAEFAKYLLEAYRGGFATEPVLRDHRERGGTIRGLLADYRPADRANLGMGVWVQHDLRRSGPETVPLNVANEHKTLLPEAPSLSRLMKELPEIVPLAMQGGGPTTFWIHPMSGEVGVYHKLAGQIRGEFKMIGLQARGFLRPQHQPLDSMAAMARHYADIITTVQAVGPYHLAGFSFGGTIAYEVARELQAHGAPVAGLLMIEAPFVSDEVAALTTMSQRSALVMNANYLVLALLTIDSTVAAALRSGASDWTRYQVTNETVAAIPDNDLPDFLAAHCRRCGAVQATEIIKQKLVTMTDVHLANLRAVQTYRTTVLERPKEIRCALLQAREAIATSKLVLNPPYLESIQRRYNSMAAVLEGWKSILPHAESVVLEGANHFELFHDEQSVNAVRHAACEFYRFWSEAHPFKPNGTPLPAARRERAAPVGLGQVQASGELGSGIAVIGMSGRFPEASDVEAFWRNLANGRSSVKSVPADRGWNIDDYYDPKPQRPAKTYCRRAAFLEDIDCFDPLFFGISPLEAELMDPSERLFLQEAWRAIEHAGYAPGRLKRRKWGVFACVKGDYPTLVQRYYPTFLAPTDSSPPARLSYALDLCGPAISIDTACSSGLAAVAHACDSLSLGSCDAAVVGAGGVYVTPNMLVTSSQSLLFSPDGECYAFDERANGTVLGEAVGVVVLKRLADAIADGDPILGVIRGWGTNQNGRTNGLTAPSALSQAALQTEVYRRHGIDPGRITMVEAHGTGTKLGDPIEYQALRESFGRHTRRERYCALGSLKTNIGHPFAAAGIVGLTKVILALQHRQIPPSLNFNRLNPLIDEAGSPFFVNAALRVWETLGDQPRLAAINSFGATGINVHVVVEEYRAQSAHCISAGHDAPVVIVLSAKGRSRLEDSCRALLEWIRRRRVDGPDSGPELRDLAYTLQVARDPMEARLAFVAKSIDELELRLASAVETSAVPNPPYYAEVKPGRTAAKAVSLRELGAAAGEATAAALDRVAQAWVNGASMDWDVLYPETKPRRINLPGYVFARDRCWVGSTPQAAGRAPSTIAAQERLHPVLHRNSSTLGRTRYSSFFTGTEFFLADHIVNAERILPAVAYLELAREAAVRAMPGWSAGGPHSVLCLKNVVWLRPFAVGTEGREIHVELETRREGEIAFEVYSGEAGNPARHVVHSQGSVELRPGTATMKAANLGLLQARCNRATLSADSCYAAFRENRVDYGPGHRGVVRIHVGGTRSTDAEVLARLELPAEVREGSDCFVLHPSLLDSALQAALGLAYVETPAEGPKQLSLPFALDEIEIHGPCMPEMWAHLRRAQTADAGESVEKLDIDLYDCTGGGLIRLRGFSSKVLGNSASEAEGSGRLATLMFVPVWRQAMLRNPGSRPLSRWVIAVNPAGQGALPSRGLEDRVEVSRIELREGIASEQYAQLALELFARIRTRLRAKTDQRLLMQVALPGGAHRRLFSAVSALLRTAEQECPRILGQVIEFSGEGWPSDVFERIDRWSLSAEDKEVRDEGAAGRVLHWERLLPSEAAPAMVWRDGGVYLITGGAGGLGWVFAREIAERVHRPVVILAGRSSAETLDAAKLDKLRSSGAIISYEQVDVIQRAAVDRLIGGIIAQHGALHGVLHAAGVVRDRLIVNKTDEEFAAVLASKVAGTANLDEASRSIPLELFVLFSSGAGVLGNPGQADYAAANAFMDRFAEVRREQIIAGERHGRTFSVNWPLWENGGMKVSQEAVASIARSLGVVPLRTASGLSAFYDAYASTASQVMVLEGDPARIMPPVAPSQDESSVRGAASLPEASRSATGAGTWRDQAVVYFQSLIANTLKLPVRRLDPTESFEKYGVDSIVATALVNQLEEAYGSLPKTLFFEYQNI
ncbi:MAG TPA: SDR family NAD(P)-dependent oxidoreductase, partial [Silvibacterium sp.]|nr:SDR family NAD(P)-dependent oxidoreductase [Silvibacterium sp.]